MMKNLGKKLAAVFILFLVISGTSSSEKQEPWKLEISLEKDTFLLREPIWLDVVLTNISNDTLRSRGLYPPCQGSGFCIELTDSVGDSVRYSGPLHDIVWGPGFLIFSKEQYYNCFNLLELFATSRKRFDALSCGDYTVQGVYNGTVFNRISFTVVEPQRAEKEAELSLLDAFGAPLNRPVDSDRVVQLRMLETYPNSVYAEIAALRLLKYNEFLEGFPNSGYTRSSLTGIMIELTDEEKIAFLQNAIIKYKGTRAARHAEQLLRRQRK